MMSTDHLQNLYAFVAIADAGSLAGGARVRGQSAPAMTRALAALEARLGVQLILRTTRSLMLTEAGERFLADTRLTLAAIEDAEAAVTRQGQEVRGELAVTAPELFGERIVAPLVYEFLDLHPQVRARLFFANRLVHLLDEGFDVALRIAPLPDSGLTAVSIGRMRVVLVASPDYLRRHGTPRSPRELEGHVGIGFDSDGLGPGPWTFKRQRAARIPQQRLVVNTGASRVSATLAGQGLARCLAYQVAEEVEQGRLTVLLPNFELPPVPVHLVYPAGRGASAKVRTFVQFAADRLRAMPLLNGGSL